MKHKGESMSTKHPYGLTRKVSLRYLDAVSKVTEELKKEGFGILTEIDVKETLKKKLGVDVRTYKILGACNPQLAYQALRQEPDIGLLLPCNVIVYEDTKGETVISIVNPKVSLGRVENKALEPLADEALKRLTRALEAVEQA
jgi:uncharacterized protein (DUF302 family)